MNTESTIRAVRTWLTRFVIGEALCPFARRPFEAGRIRFAVTDAQSERALLDVLTREIERLSRDSEIETTLLIHPQVLTDFLTYNQFLDDAEALIRSMQMEGMFQIASFHPDYQFAGTNANDAGNYSNRAPFPLLHLIREDSVAAATESYADIDEIPRRNIRHLESIGSAELAARLRACCETG